MLLCEYKAEFTDAIAKTSQIPFSWSIFFIFYVFAVSIVFELVKAFTIEVAISPSFRVWLNHVCIGMACALGCHKIRFVA